MAQRSSSIDIQDLQDTRPPFGVPLSGIYKRSFAYVTIKDRLPVILTKVIDSLSRNKENMVQQYGPNATEEIKHITGFISKLKNEMVTNKVLKPLPVLENATDNDAAEWNKYFEKKTEEECGTPTWFNTTWLYCECYMYRSLIQEIAIMKYINTYDPFQEQKEEGFINSMNSIQILCAYVMNIMRAADGLSQTKVKKELVTFLKLSLWGNRCDLSLSAGADVRQSGNPVELLASLDKDILVNNSEFVWNVLSQKKANGEDIVDIVFDNAGYELFADLCLAAYLVTNKLAQKIRFYVKHYPWYVSDTTTKDLRWTIEYMKKSSNADLQALAQLAQDYLNNKTWTIEDELYWTGPYDYAQMKTQDPTLYAKFTEAKLVIFKGDLNYRKLVGDINWEYSTKFNQALRDFRPTNVLSLRTVKADVCVGLAPGLADTLFEKDENWMFTGQYGLIQATIDTDC
ncbi:hypothetical protein KM043_000650 [Ampulex compressa]|nr:hypothetical protein KM043_000650 [Ampulex compressa]